MADYPPTPPYGMAPSRAAQNYHDASHREIYDYGDPGPIEGRPLLEYQKAQTNATFQQNAEMPALSATSLASAISPLPIYKGREDASYSYSHNSPGESTQFETSRNHNTYTNASRLSPHALDHKRPSSYTSAVRIVEEGELSEGEFEEARPPVNRNVSGAFRRRDYYQTDDRLVPAYRQEYDSSGEREVTSNAPLTDIYGRSLDLNRHRSESYSPYEPPNEIEYEPCPAQETFAPQPQLTYHEDYEPPDEFERVLSNARQSGYQSELSHAESHRPSGRSHLEQKASQANIDMLAPETSGSNSVFKSLHDARKEAQNAILNLLPLKIRYQDYVEEGIHEEVIRRQFESLGVPLAPAETFPTKSQATDVVAGSPKLVSGESPSSVNHQTLQVNKTHGNDSVPSHENLTSEPSSTQATKPVDRALGNQNTAELRKDRIARLLAEKTKKHPSPVMQLDSSIPSASPEVSSLPKLASTSQATAKADKERLLRQKMEALQKSREQRAQKAAAKTATTSPVVTASTSDSTVAQQPVDPPKSIKQLPFEPPPVGSASPVQTVNKQGLPSIPGLFLAAGPNVPRSPISNNTTLNVAHNSIQRKRPVASDFDRPSSTASSHKRPFGQSINDQPLVIDVSDDDSEEGNFVEMEIDHPQPNCSVNNLQNGTITAKAKAIRELPPLSDFPPRKSFPTPSSAMSTPSAPQATKTSVSKPEDLLKKEMEIQEMKKKIAEAEKRKWAKQNISGSQTPRSNDSTSSPVKNNGASVTDKIETSVQIERLIDDASCEVNQDLQKLDEVHAEERANADELKRSEAEQRRLRRAEIASSLPIVNAEVEKAQKKLEGLRFEMAKIEAAVQKGLDDKKRMAEEMERLSQEADEQLQAQKEKLQELRLEEAAENKVSAPLEDSNLISRANTPTAADDNNIITMSGVEPTMNLDLQQTVQSGPGSNDSDSEAPISRLTSREEPVRQAVTARDSSGIASPDQGDEHEHDGSSSYMTPDQALEAALQEATAQAEALSDAGSSSDVNMVDAYAPDPDVLAPTSTESQTGNSQKNNNGPVEGSEDLIDIAGGESDQYEPPEATPPPKDDVPAADSPPFSPAPPETISENSHTERQHDDISIGPAEAALPKDLTRSNNSTFSQPQANQNSSSLTSRKTLFNPYESPLKNFRAFRFHPTFEQEVQGGFKSITYSNKIKEDKEFCRYELAGGVCNDTTCEFQHFRDIGLAGAWSLRRNIRIPNSSCPIRSLADFRLLTADDEILVELGNSAGYNEEDKPRFVAGLRTVLQGLRHKKTKDFHVIASEIAAYRARFFGDKSKILLLDDTST